MQVLARAEHPVDTSLWQERLLAALSSILDAASAVVPGLVLGLAAYAACSRAVAALLYGVAPWDAMSVSGAAACLIAVAVCATLFPAVHAAVIQPSQALRDE
jgi:ABC-type antimicrobial peptide transport system permease subunit